MQRLLIIFSLLILAGCQSIQPSSSSLISSLDNISPEQQAWAFLRNVEKSRPKQVNAYRVCRINSDNSVSDAFYEQGKSFIDANVPAWHDGEIISTTDDPKKINMKVRKLGAIWVVQMVFEPTSKQHCEFNPASKNNVCDPSWCNLTMSSGKLKPAEKDDYLKKIATAATTVGMQISYE